MSVLWNYHQDYQGRHRAPRKHVKIITIDTMFTALAIACVPVLTELAIVTVSFNSMFHP